MTLRDKVRELLGLRQELNRGPEDDFGGDRVAIAAVDAIPPDGSGDLDEFFSSVGVEVGLESLEVPRALQRRIAQPPAEPERFADTVAGAHKEEEGDPQAPEQSHFDLAFDMVLCNTTAEPESV